MRVLHVITRMILGGAQENTLLTCEGLHARGHEVMLATGPALGPEGDLLARARRGGYAVEIVESLRREIHPVRDAAALGELDRLIRAFRPDIVHTHSSKAGILGRAAAVRRRVPWVVHTLHGVAFGATASLLENAVYVPLEQVAARFTHRLISVADAMTTQALAAGVGRPEQYVTIRSGMELDPFLAAPALREKVRAELGLAPGELAVGKVARLAPRKGFEDVLHAAARVCRERPEVRFVLVGDGPLRDDIAARVRTAGLQEKVILTGLVPPDRIPGLMAAFDVLVHASRREGLPRVAPQALLTGTPVVCCDADGAPEVVLPEQTGLLFAPGDIDAMTAGLLRLLGDRMLRQRLGQNGREFCRTRFGADLMSARIEAEYLALRDGRPPAIPSPAAAPKRRLGLRMLG